MSILWDAPMTAALARELSGRLEDARLRALRMDRERRNLVLHFRELTLVARLHPLHGDFSLHPPRDPPPGARTLKASVRRIHAPPDERLLMIQLQPSGGSASPEGLVVELMTNQWNAIWLEVGSDRIREVLHPREAGERLLLRGEIYRPPSPSERAGIDEPLSPDEWRELLEPLAPEDRRGALLRSVAFTSSANAPALLEAGDGLDAGYRTWRRIRAVSLGEEPHEPCLLHTEKRVLPYPVALEAAGSRIDRVPSFLEGVEAAAAPAGEEEPATAALVPADLMERAEDAADDAARRVRRLEEELEELPDEEPVRRTGDLILARYGSVERGAETITLEGFDGEPVEVELDPALGPRENAERYYDEAARIERARERLPGLTEEARDRARELEELLERARRGDVALEELEERLPPPPSRGRKDARDRPRLPYRKYRSSGGLEIRVGRGAKANDDLTFHHSSPDDVWLHARQVAGAHVILRWQEEGSPPGRDLAQAASLAALHSDARHASSVPVDWTRRKYVRSPRKSPAGVVVPDRVKTVFVDPDRELERSLREE